MKNVYTTICGVTSYPDPAKTILYTAAKMAGTSKIIFIIQKTHRCGGDIMFWVYVHSTGKTCRIFYFIFVMGRTLFPGCEKPYR